MFWVWCTSRATVYASSDTFSHLYSAVFSAQSRADEDRQSSDKETRAQGQQQAMHSFLSTGRVKNGRFSMQGKAIQWQYSGLTEPYVTRACREEKGVGWEDSVTSLRDWGKRMVHVTRFLFVMIFLMKSRLLSLLDGKGCVAAKLVFAVNYTFANTNDRRIWILMMQHYPKPGHRGMAPDCIYSILKLLLNEAIFPATCNAAPFARQVVNEFAHVAEPVHAVWLATFTRYVAACNMFSTTCNTMLSCLL